MANERVNPRTARTPNGEGPYYVLVEGAPKHYVDGYGLVRGGAVVTLAPGVDPGKYYVEITAEEYAKAGADETFAQALAAVAKAKANERQAGDRERKRVLDQQALSDRNAQAEEAARKEAAALQQAADAQRKADEASEAGKQAEDRAKAAEQALEDERQRLAAAEAELAKYRERDESQKQQAASKSK